MTPTLRAAITALGDTLTAIRHWITAWAPHTRAIVATFLILWVVFVLTCGITAGTALLIMSLLIIVAAIHLVRGEWRRPRYISPLTVCDNAAQQLHTLATQRGDHHWYLPNVITVELHPADYRELAEHFAIANVITDLTRETTNVARRYHARTPSGLPPLIQITPNPAVRAHRFALTAADHQLSPIPVDRTRVYADTPADRTVLAAPRAHPILIGPDNHPHPLVGTDITVGRSPDCDITISDDPRISRHHLTLAHNDGVWWCQDTSSNGVLINGHQISPATWTPLDNGDTLTFGTSPNRHAATFYLQASTVP